MITWTTSHDLHIAYGSGRGELQDDDGNFSAGPALRLSHDADGDDGLVIQAPTREHIVARLRNIAELIEGLPE